MGICASCLGRDRHPSREVDESDPLLDDAQTVRYGAAGADEVAQPDEEELEREREALNRITMQATESMIDVLHPDGVTISHHLTPNSTLRHKNQETASQSTTTPSTQEAEDAEDAEEQAWLDSITSTEPGSVTHIKALHKGALVMDIGQLRESAPPPSARKASKAAIRM